MIKVQSRVKPLNPLILASIGLLTAAPVTTFAADGLEEIIVTARKTEETSQKVPISLTALSGEELQRNIPDRSRRRHLRRRPDYR